MLRWIRVRNIAVIDELEIDFAPGLNLLTGETGAGKSILIDALGLVLGARASSELVRSGTETAEVEAGFELDRLPQNLRARLDEAGIQVDEGAIVIRREVSSSGRGKIALNGRAGSAGLLRDLSPFLADIHGQGETLSLFRPDAGLELLDRMAGREDLCAEVSERYRRLLDLEQAETELEREAEVRRSREEILDYQLREIDAADPRPGEDQTLEEERRLLAHAERLRQLADEAYGALYEDEEAVLEKLTRVLRRVEELASIDARFEPYRDAESTVRSQLDDLALFLRDYRNTIESSPQRLAVVEERLLELDRLKKKYGGDLESVLAHRDRARAELERFTENTERLEQVRAEIADVVASYVAAAGTLSRERRHAAERVEKRVGKELKTLALDKARFRIQLTSAFDDTAGASASTEHRKKWKETGLDDVELLFSANPGEELRPLTRVASGGELSRFLLALKSVAAKGELPKTLVFDEVDVGIGGRVADVVGQKLRELSGVHQVICVTHLPQIASFANEHYRIEKQQAGSRMRTLVERLDPEGRVDEIARMLAGSVVTETARRHAKQLVTDKQ